MEKKEKFEVRMRLFYLRLHLGEQESVKLIDETNTRSVSISSGGPDSSRGGLTSWTQVVRTVRVRLA